MQAKLTQSHTMLNGMFKETVDRKNKFEKDLENTSDRLIQLESVNKMLDGRTAEQSKHLERLQIMADNLTKTKQDKSNFYEQKNQIQGQFDEVNKDLDVLLNKIKTMEHFINKYIPIRIQQLIGQTINAIGSQSQLTRMQNYEMEKYKKLNEDVLDDESNPELMDLMRSVAKELTDTVQRFKAIARAKGIRYEIAAAKKDAIEKKIGIDTTSFEGSSLGNLEANKSRMSLQ